MANYDNLDLSEFTLDDFVDVGILVHGFVPYKRDYFFHIETLWREPWAGQYVLLFRHCYEFNYSTVADPKVINESWDDAFIDFEKYQAAGEPEGYVWGTNHMLAYPGFRLVKDSQKAAVWSARLGKQMQETCLEAEIFQMSLVFYDWTLTKVNDQTNLIRQIIFPIS
jgi:hypothetical protein